MDTCRGSFHAQLLYDVADEIDFKGNANLEMHCTGTGVAAIGGSSSKLVE